MNLLDAAMSSYVQLTNLTRKLTLDGETKAYPVYRVKLECLFYNDQNDRIATYIGQYRSENGDDAFKSLSMTEYNDLIEKFIIESNPAAIEKTQMNIKLVNQREPGVVLADGRVIDGNRRFTCLRRLAAEDSDFGWFETVILDMKLKTSRKQIKMLELAIQHGEEKKVDYNPIDRIVGIYQDIIKTQLLTVKEYADSTNESVAEVNKRIEQAELLCEFLEYIKLPEQFHVARDYQIVSILGDLIMLLKKCRNDAERDALKISVFNNIMMRTTGDSRKYIRNLSSMIENRMITNYLKQQGLIGKEITEKLQAAEATTQEELEAMIGENTDLAEDLRNSFELSVQKTKKRETKARPAQIVSKSISMLKDVDTKVFDTLNEYERERLKDNIVRLSGVVREIDSKATPTKTVEPQAEPAKTPETNISEFRIAERHIEEPMLVCLDMSKTITNLTFTLEFRLDEPLNHQKNQAAYEMFFISSDNEQAGALNRVTFVSGEPQKCTFTLPSSMSSQSKCYLAIRSALDDERSLQQKIPFKLKIIFEADFGF